MEAVDHADLAEAEAGGPPEDEHSEGEGATTPAAPKAGPSVWPALIVVAIAVSIVIFGAAVALLGSSGPPPPVSGARQPSIKGTAIAAVAAGIVLRHIESAGQPPADVVAHLVVPAASHFTGRSFGDAGVDQYDATVNLDDPSAPGAVLRFFRAWLIHDGWQTFAVSRPANGGGQEILAQRQSSDGYYWEVGAVVKAVEPAITPALGGGASESPTSRIALRIFEVDDSG
jgi:hypothetical protein